ncbi:2-amino-4-hydroxy-6-hydroxymethyldihydropteridin epyrophosphokinase [Mycolicibacterium brisbanense]|uniref:2-amino-4-hydroxy-6-hydroxymethyldihydropteridin epyrophosphokinase n=1 Tax=Mycolicibacterium brisbanense TaxID=146020 RepID=A0A117I7R6_9MYCO|nr:2-amino-4-hydroxy-6-hydroxymethyldihydropteridin epyrophosphokinase [Mycolicibacterium brisbanense]
MAVPMKLAKATLFIGLGVGLATEFGSPSIWSCWVICLFSRHGVRREVSRSPGRFLSGMPGGTMAPATRVTANVAG